jgi:chromosome segregation ATPase
MKKILFGLSTVGALLVSVSHVDARMLLASSDWSVNKIDTATPYCTLAREYEAGAVVTFAKNAKGEGTVAIDFQRDAFDVTRPYPITLRAGNVLRQYVVKPVNSSTIIMRTSTDTSLFEGMEGTSRLNIQIDSEKFDLDLSGYKKAFADMNSCAGVEQRVKIAAIQPEIPVQNVEVRTPRAPVLQETANAQSAQITELLNENRRLTQELSKPQKVIAAPPSVPASLPNNGELLGKLADAEKRNLELMRKVSVLEKQVASVQASYNPDLTSVVAEKEAQIASLKSQNDALKQAVVDARNVAPEVIVKEIIKEVPSIPVGMAQNDAEMALRLADAETQAMSFKAERDEYRRLLQNERKRLKEMGDMSGQISGIQGQSNDLVADIRRLETEKVELIRELEFVKSSVNPSVAPSENNQKALNDLSDQLDYMKAELNKLAIEKKSLKVQLAQAESASQASKKKLSEMKVNELSKGDSENDLELQTMRAEIAALEAQNLNLREDVTRLNAREPEVVVKEIIKTVEKQIPEAPVQSLSAEPIDVAVSTPSPVVTQQKVNKVTGKITASEARKQLRDRLQNKSKIAAPMPAVVEKKPASPSVIPSQPENIESPKMVALSGDNIRQLISASRIPLQAQVGRVNSVSGPDFAAFKWDTGMVYGSGEQSRLNNISAFDGSVKQYIQKTASRCSGTFDQTIIPVQTSNGLTVKSADIACVDNQGQGHAASILFFAKNGMFYALAHEADMNSFEIAMDMRERLSNALKSVF